MATGVIRWFSESRGYGFIESDDERESQPLYVHHTAILGRGYRSLQAGQHVRYQIERLGPHLRAVDVEAL